MTTSVKVKKKVNQIEYYESPIVSWFWAGFLCILLVIVPFDSVTAQSEIEISKEVTFKSKGVTLAGTIYKPKNPIAAMVIVHGSDSVPRMNDFADLLAQNGISVLTYDKRGVAESGGIYVGPEVGTNNISQENLDLLAEDVSSAVDLLNQEIKNIPIGLVGFSQAGWIIPIVANKNPLVQFMVLFSCPTINTLEQLRFQFYTDGRTDFWDNHTDEDAREHVHNDPDKYQFAATDPKDFLGKLSIPGLWLFGEKDIQIPVGMCIEQLNSLKAKGKPFEYALFSNLGHNTAFATSWLPFDISTHWIRQKVMDLQLNNTK
ncbi:MAG: alpha/beta hydrolase [Bacteroidota bacterium]